MPCCRARGLSESLVDPALALLAARGAQVSFGHRLRSLTVTAGAVASLDFGAKGQVDVAADEAVLLAVNAPVAVDLLPDLVAPTEFRGIVNAHYRIEPANAAPNSFLGVIGGTAEWVFVKPGHVSVTISAAEHLIDRAAEDLAQAIWRDVQRALELGRDAHAAMAHRQGEARHLRRHAGATAAAARPCDTASQHVPGR